MDSVELRKVSHFSNVLEVWLYRSNKNIAEPNPEDGMGDHTSTFEGRKYDKIPNSEGCWIYMC